MTSKLYLAKTYEYRGFVGLMTSSYINDPFPRYKENFVWEYKGLPPVDPGPGDDGIVYKRLYQLKLFMAVDPLAEKTD